MIKLNLTKHASVPHEVKAKYGSSRVLIMRAPGKGILAGSSVRTVLELGSEADGDSALLKIVDIPDDIDWVIEEYDGSEWVSEKHRTWS